MRSVCWKLRSQTLNFSDGPALMGILNVTPDSFSDGGRYRHLDAAIDRGLQLVAEGAAILDIGGESTRPYSTPVEETEELRRVVPVIERLVQKVSVPISIDTSKAAVAKAAISAGAEIINDVTGLEGDPKMVEVARASGAGVCAMHMQGTVQTMQDAPHYNNVVEDIFGYLEQRKTCLIEAGLQPEKICLDPGIGFGKTHEHNWELLRQSGRFLALNQPILVGHSRKGFIANLLGDKEVERDSASTAIALFLAQQGVQVIRLHEVAAASRGVAAIRRCGGLG